MDARPLTGPGDPEGIVKRAFVKLLRQRKWYVIVTHGNKFQKGLPDLYIAHKAHGARWVEVKHAKKYSFTTDQLIEFPKLSEAGVGIWIVALTPDFTETQIEFEYRLVVDNAPNWYQFLGRSSKR